MKIEILQESRVTIPLIPSFIRLDGVMRPISEFTPAQLRAIGEEWVKRLIERAGEQKALKL